MLANSAAASGARSVSAASILHVRPDTSDAVEPLRCFLVILMNDAPKLSSMERHCTGEELFYDITNTFNLMYLDNDLRAT